MSRMLPADLPAFEIPGSGLSATILLNIESCFLNPPQHSIEHDSIFGRLCLPIIQNKVSDGDEGEKPHFLVADLFRPCYGFVKA